jgi:signal transduction histidine kinase
MVYLPSMAASHPVIKPLPSSTWIHHWIFYLAAGFMFTAASLRAFLVYQHTAQFGQIILLLVGWAAIFACDVAFFGKQPRLHILLIGMEVLFILIMLLITQTDFFAFLFAVPCMQSMQRFSLKATAFLIGFTSLATVTILIKPYGISQTMALALVYCGGTIFLVTYVHSTRRARSAEDQQQVLVTSLQQANQRLEAASGQMKQLSVVRERQRLARELHDSVTQTIFSMTLTTQSARLLLDRDLHQVAVQLERLDQLAQSALAEMQLLIARLAPEQQAGSRLLPALQAHTTNRLKLDNLEVLLDVKSIGPLETFEEASLFRIAQEALNNIVKHAQVNQATIRIQLEDLPWMEIEDHGVGFNVKEVHSASQFGLASMQERATEIGWDLQVHSSPGSGTRIRIEKSAGGEKPA